MRSTIASAAWPDGGDQHGDAGLLQRVGEEAQRLRANRRRPARCRAAGRRQPWLCPPRRRRVRKAVKPAEVEGLDDSARSASTKARLFGRARAGRRAWPRCRAHSRSRPAAAVRATMVGAGRGSGAGLRLAARAGASSLDPVEAEMHRRACRAAAARRTAWRCASSWPSSAGGRRRLADIGRQHHDRRRLAALAQLLDQLPAVHAGHRDVDEEEIGPDALDQRQAFRRRRRPSARRSRAAPASRASARDGPRCRRRRRWCGAGRYSRRSCGSGRRRRLGRSMADSISRTLKVRPLPRSLLDGDLAAQRAASAAW